MIFWGLPCREFPDGPLCPPSLSELRPSPTVVGYGRRRSEGPPCAFTHGGLHPWSPAKADKFQPSVENKKRRSAVFGCKKIKVTGKSLHFLTSFVILSRIKLYQTRGLNPRVRPKGRATASPPCGVMDRDSTGEPPSALCPPQKAGFTLN